MMGGQYAVGWTPDFDDHLPDSGHPALSKLLSLKPSRTRPISVGLRLRIPCSTTQKWYYLRGTEDKDCEYGKIFICVAVPLSSVTSGTSTDLLVRMRWAYEFQMPDMPTNSGPEGQAIFPQYRDSKIFTTSSSDWKSARYLTFKYTSGGQIVGFPGAKKGTIYMIQSGANINYVKADGTKEAIKYATPNGESAEEGYLLMTPFTTHDKAKEYIDSNYSDTKLIPYKGAGDYSAFPDVAFYPVEKLDLVRVARIPELAQSRTIPPTLGAYLVHDHIGNKLMEGAQAEYRRVMADSRKRPSKGLMAEALQNIKKLSVIDYTFGADLFTALRTAPFDFIPDIPIEDKTKLKGNEQEYTTSEDEEEDVPSRDPSPTRASILEREPIPHASHQEPPMAPAPYKGREIEVLELILEKLKTVEDKVEALEKRTPASSLVDLATEVHADMGD